MPDPTPLGELLERARTGLGISVRAAARRAGISEAHWRQVVAGYQLRRGQQTTVRPKTRTVVAMALAVYVDPATALQAAGLPVPDDLDVMIADIQTEMRQTAEARPGAGPVVDLSREDHERLTAEISRIESSPLPESAKLVMLEALIRAWTRYGAARAAQRDGRDQTA